MSNLQEAIWRLTAILEDLMLLNEAASPAPWNYCGMVGGNNAHCTCGHVYSQSADEGIAKMLKSDNYDGMAANEATQNRNAELIVSYRNATPTILLMLKLLIASAERSMNAIEDMSVDNNTEKFDTNTIATIAKIYVDLYSTVSGALEHAKKIEAVCPKSP